MKKGVKSSRGLSLSKSRELQGILLLIPASISILMFKYFPILLGVFETFFKMDIVHLPGKFIGFDNYVRAFTDTQFLNAFWHNAKFLLYQTVMQFWVPLFLALLIDEVRKGRTLFRLVYYIPACAPAIAMTVLWKYFWQPDYGLANALLGFFNIEPQLWLNSEKWVYFCMTFPKLVVGGGMQMVIYLAALQDVPKEQYEAALIDGVSIWQRIRYITVPTIKGVVVLMYTMAIISALGFMEDVLIWTGGGPANATQTLLLYAYQQATNSMDYSYAMTMITIVFIFTMILTLIFNKITKEKE